MFACVFELDSELILGKDYCTLRWFYIVFVSESAQSLHSDVHIYKYYKAFHEQKSDGNPTTFKVIKNHSSVITIASSISIETINLYKDEMLLTCTSDGTFPKSLGFM